MKRSKLFVLVLLLSLIYIKSVYTQTCEDCKHRNILIYDNNILIPRPTGPDSVIRKTIPIWWNLFFISNAENGYFWSDATKDCLIKYDAGFFTSADTASKSLITGMEHAHIAPQGPLGLAFSYLIEGTISGSPNNYTLTIYLEAAQTREVVKQATFNFDDSFDPLVIGRNAFSALGPLYTSMMDFEKKKRDSGDPYAINPITTATPANTSIHLNESTPVTFVLKDCDGTLLSNRKLTLTATLGSFNPTEITTDGNGKATSTFTSDGTKGAATVKANYSYQRAYDLSGVSSSDDGTAFIQVDQQSVWYMHGSFSYNYDATIDQTIIGDQGTVTSHVEKVENHNVPHFKAILVPTTLGKSILHSVFKVSGWEYDGWFEDFDNQFSTISGGSFYSKSTSNKLCCGHVATDISPNPNFSIIGSNMGASIEVGADLLGGGKSYDFEIAGSTVIKDEVADITCDSKLERDGMTFPEMKIGTDTTYENSSHQDLGGGVSNDGRSKVFLTAVYHNPGEYYLYFVFDTTYTYTAPNYKQVIWWRQWFYAYLDSNTVTGVNDKNVIAPRNYLYSNYPNPFNPSTVIQYSLERPGDVKLVIYDILGKEVKTLVNGNQTSGNHYMTFNANGLPSGIYFYILKTANYTAAKKMMLVK